MGRTDLVTVLRRIEDKRGLTKSMRASLNAHPEMVQMIERTVGYLAETGGYMTRMQLWRELLVTTDEWNNEVPILIANFSDQDHPDHVRFVGGIHFEKLPKYQFPVFSGALTIAKHVGLIAGWGRIGLAPEFRMKAAAPAITQVAE